MTLADCRAMLRWASLFLLSGCVGDLVELTPGARTDMAQQQQVEVDMAGPGGNDDLAMPPPHFNPTIQADIDTLGCSAASCHGGTQVPLLKRLPVAQADIDANYAAFKAEAMNGEQSNILVKNL